MGAPWTCRWHQGLRILLLRAVRRVLPGCQQNSQKTEQALEELKADYRETKDKLDAKTLSLKHNIHELEQQIGQCWAGQTQPDE